MEIYAADGDPTDLDVPENLELVVKTVNLYNELSSSNVSILQLQ